MKQQAYQSVASVLATLALSAALWSAPAHAEDAAAEAAAEAADADQGQAVIVTGQREQATQVAAEAVQYGNYVQIVTSQEIAASGARRPRHAGRA